MRRQYFYGYNIVAAGFVTQAVCIGAMFTYGVFFKELQDAFGWSRTMISGASSMAFLIMGGGAAVAGGLNDRIGPRIILTTSAVATGVGYLLMAGIQSMWQLYLLYGCLVGLGFATHDVITLSTAARWFVKRRGTMSGLLKVGTGAGQLTVPLITSSLICCIVSSYSSSSFSPSILDCFTFWRLAEPWKRFQRMASEAMTKSSLPVKLYFSP